MGKKSYEIAPKEAINYLIKNKSSFNVKESDLKTLTEQSKFRWDYIQNNYDELPVYNPGNNPLMLLQEEKNNLPICCVYNHVDPETGDIKYIGKGPHCRAYETFLRRDHDHAIWFLEKMNQGFDILDIVKITDSGLLDSEAYEVETKALRLFKEQNGDTPFFNKT